MTAIELLFYTFTFLLFFISIFIYAVCSVTYRIRLESIKHEYENKINKQRNQNV